jgi:hypothetical protein
MKLRHLIPIICMLAASCAPQRGLVFQDVDSIRVNPKKTSPLQINLRVYNPNFHYVNIEAAAAYVYINNRYLGRLTIDHCFYIKRRTTALVPLIIPPDMLIEFPDLHESVFDSTFSIRIDGTITAGKKKACMSTDIDYETVKHPQPKNKR